MNATSPAPSIPEIQRLRGNLNRAIVGKDEAITLVLVALLCDGHALLEDVPGVGKTLLAKSLATSIGGKFQRVQCTPDLLPSDITGTNIWNPQSGEFQFLPGPVFANVLLADEINRATPRTQSALLEVMEEQQVTVDGVTRLVESPFFTIATQNPVEYQGTFPLPEAQMDRFALSFSLGYPTEAEELQMLQRIGGARSQPLEACLSLEQLGDLRSRCLGVKVETVVQEYLLALVRQTREHPEVALGVSPRGTVALQRTSQALAFLLGRDFVLPDDIKAIAPHVLTHRIVPSGGRSSKDIVRELLETIAVP
ncbi:MAG: AAA family ATPase [Geitlerinemataceae cyanobacterium]